MENKEIWVLCGHVIPKPVVALAVFIGKPTKEQLLATSNFKDQTEIDNRVIDILLQHNFAGTKDDLTNFRYEYLLLQPDNDGNLELHEQLLTGITDMYETLCVDLNEYRS